jgi:hypothetical protein
MKNTSFQLITAKKKSLTIPRHQPPVQHYAEAEKVVAKIELGVEAAAGTKLAAPKPFLAETSLETRNPFATLRRVSIYGPM